MKRVRNILSTAGVISDEILTQESFNPEALLEKIISEAAIQLYHKLHKKDHKVIDANSFLSVCKIMKLFLKLLLMGIPILDFISSSLC